VAFDGGLISSDGRARVRRRLGVSVGCKIQDLTPNT
jgi:hypothetical protein